MGRPPFLLMATRRPGGLRVDAEAEPVLVARTSTEVILILDDGDELRFDAGELEEAVKDPGAMVSARSEVPASTDLEERRSRQS